MPRKRPLPLDAIGFGLALGFGLAVAVGALANLPEEAPADPGAAVADSGPADLVLGSTDLPVRAPVDDPDRRTPVVRAVEAVAPAVVSITCEVPTADFWGRRIDASEGSGVVIDADGVVLTNAHVVQGAQRIHATFSDDTAYEADIVGVAPELDLAVLRLRGARDLVTAPRGTSADLMLGEPVIAIGNPFGLGHTVTTGVISATSRPLETDERVYQDFIQTDASINPGNSGGPLLDVHGRLVGINTAIRQDAQGIGFAIPADRALKVARDLVDFGQVRIAWLGVDVDDVALARRGGRVTAPRVTAVFEAGPARAADLQRGDVLVSVDGRSVQGRADLNAYLATIEPGQAVRVGLLRDGGPLEVALTTGALPETVLDHSLAAVLGVQLAEGEPSRGGVPVTGAVRGGAFLRAGLRAGDAIVALNGIPTPTAAALRDALRQAKAGHRDAATFTIRRGQVVGRVTLDI